MEYINASDEHSIQYGFGNFMTKLLIIGCGGFIGSVARYLASLGVQRLLEPSSFPYGTFTVNVVGCLAIGFLSQLSDRYSAFGGNARAFLIIGMLGGFTTFSTFANESYNLFSDGKTAWSVLNITGQVALCLLSVWLGRLAVQLIWRTSS